MGEYLIRQYARRVPDDSNIFGLLGSAIAMTAPIALLRALGELALCLDLVSNVSQVSFASTIGLGDPMAALSMYPIVMMVGAMPLIRL